MSEEVTYDVVTRDRSTAVLDKVGRGFGNLGKMAGTVGKGIGLAAGGAAVAGVAALGSAMVQGVRDAASYQTLAAKTAAVLKSTGNVAGTSVKHIQDLAGSLESMSGVDEELIINSQNVLATFTGIQNRVGAGNDIFDQATKTALDMSTALGTDLQGSSIQLGKALNDPVKGIGALSRVGVSFTKAQKDQIKTLVESGDTMGAQKIILGELSKEFGGAAKAAGSGFNGAMARAKDAVGDMFRNLGTKLLPVVTKVADWFTTKAVPAIAEFGKWIGPKIGAVMRVSLGVWSKLSGWFKNELMPAIRDTVQKVMPMFRLALDNLKKVFGEGSGAGSKFSTAMKVVGTVVKLLFQALVVAVAAFAVAFSVQMRVASLAMDKVIIPVVKGLLSVFRTVFGGILHAADLAFGWIPGIGPKIHGAAVAFDREMQRFQDAIDGVHGKTVWLDVKIRGANGKAIRSDLAGKIGGGAYAAGGFPRAGEVALVGEEGPELVRFGRSAQVYTNRDTMAMLSGAGRGQGGGTVIHNHYSISTPAVITNDRQLLALIDQAKARTGRSRAYVAASRA